MDFSFVDRHVHALELARECARLGARVRTIAFVTGLHKGEATRLLFDDGKASTLGKTPHSPDWIYKCNLVERVQASMIVAIYRRMRERGINPADALIASFKLYAAHFDCMAPPSTGKPLLVADRARVNFDRAFSLVCHVDGIWTVTQRSLSLVACCECDSDYVSALSLGARERLECPFCRLLRRYAIDKRYQQLFPPRVMPRLEDVQLGLLSRLIEAHS